MKKTLYHTIKIALILWLMLSFSACPNITDDQVAFTPNKALLDGILAELNFVRTQPHKYADEVIAPRVACFEGNMYHAPGATIALRTQEGAQAVRDCVTVLRASGPIVALSHATGLTKSAQWLADDQASTGNTGHTGSDGSTPFVRMNRFGRWYNTAAENCAYGSKSAREIVAQLMIDDGVADRGHRKNILNGALKKVGVGYNDTNKAPYGAVSVMDFAGDYTSSP